MWRSTSFSCVAAASAAFAAVTVLAVPRCMDGGLVYDHCWWSIEWTGVEQ